MSKSELVELPVLDTGPTFRIGLDFLLCGIEARTSTWRAAERPGRHQVGADALARRSRPKRAETDVALNFPVCWQSMAPLPH
ncbi:hypothetical protein [Streptomyces bobili]|uniref:hypothetical protein n=1 Tax=Streptomyces bobili TaxID=67280 RepID=UPI00378CCE7D